MDPRSGSVTLLEAGDGMDVTAFSNITGQVDLFEDPAGVHAGGVRRLEARRDDSHPARRRKDSRHRPRERRSGRGAAGHAVSQPGLRRRLHRDPVNHQAWFHRAGDARKPSSSTAPTSILQRAAEVGEVLGLNKEKRLHRPADRHTNSYNWKGTAYNTYHGPADNGPWVNVLSEELVDWTDIDAAEQLFANILDPEHRASRS